MEKSKNNSILNILSFSPPIIIIIVCIIAVFYISKQHEYNLEKSKEEFTSSYIKINKNKIQVEVDTLVNQLERLLENSQNDLKKDIKNHVGTAHQIMSSLYEKYSKSRSKEEIISMMKYALRDIRFYEGRGYYFIHQMDGVNVLHPILPNREGVNIGLKRDKNGVQRFMVLKDSVINKDGFESFLFFHPHDKTKQKSKIIYAEHFKPYDLMIGSGEYINDFNSVIKLKFIEQFYIPHHTNQNNIFILSDLDKTIKQSSLKVKEFITSDKKSSFIETNTNKEISYLKKINNLNFIIGGKFSLDELNKQILLKHSQLESKYKKDIKILFITSIFITIPFLIISFFIAKFLKKKFKEYESNIINNEKTLAEKSKMAAMGEMIDVIIHQWKTPLGIIQMHVQLNQISIEEGKFNKNQLNDSLEKISVQIEHLDNTTSEFRNFFRPTKKIESVSFSNLIDSTLHLMKGELIKNYISTEFKCEEDTFVKINKNEFLHVFINFIQNSRDAFIEKKIENRKIEFIMFKQNGKPILEIKDNAGGIPEDIIDKIFEPNFTTKDEDIGTGIGLYYSKQIIEKNHAKIKVENIQDGVCFSIIFDQ